MNDFDLEMYDEECRVRDIAMDDSDADLGFEVTGCEAE